MESHKIGFGEALCIILIVILSHLILILPKAILESQGSSSIINVFYITILAFILIFILNKLYKNFKGKDIIDISEFTFGKTFKIILGIVFIFYFLFVASLLVRNTSESLKTMYFQNTPIPYLVFFLLLGAGIINKLGTKTVIKCNLIIVPSIVVILIALFIVSANNFVPERIFPIFGYGAKNIFINGTANIYAFSNIVFLLFIMPLLKDFNHFNKIGYSSIAISGIFILLATIALLLMFPLEISSGSNVPIYMQTREITLGDFIQRTDAFFVIIWILTILSYLSIILTFILSIFKKITNIQNKSALTYCFLAILFGISLLYSNILQVRYIQSTIYKYIFIIFVLAICFGILIIANIKNVLKNKSERINHSE